MDKLGSNPEWLAGIAEIVQGAYNSPKFSDIAVHSGGKMISVNSMVLASQSPALRDIVLGM